MTRNSFIEKARDCMFSLSRSALIPATLADDLIDIYCNQSPLPQMRNGQLLPPREWAEAVMYDAAKMYNVIWSPTPDDLRDLEI